MRPHPGTKNSESGSEHEPTRADHADGLFLDVADTARGQRPEHGTLEDDRRIAAFDDRLDGGATGGDLDVRRR